MVFLKSMHRLVGLWSVPFVLLFSVTGMWYFMERADVGDLRRMVNPRGPKIGVIPEDVDSTANFSYTMDYDRAVAIAESQIPNFEVQTLSPASSYKGTIYVRGHSDVPLVRQRANRVYLDPHSYEVLQVQNAKDISTVMWLNDIADPLHFGYWGGLLTKVIWFIMGLGICSLILSGIWTTLKRNALRRRKSKEKMLGFWKYLNWGFYLVMMYFMYKRLIVTYQVSLVCLVVISLGWVVLFGCGYYVFVHRLKQVEPKGGLRRTVVTSQL